MKQIITVEDSFLSSKGSANITNNSNPTTLGVRGSCISSNNNFKENINCNIGTKTVGIDDKSTQHPHLASHLISQPKEEIKLTSSLKTKHLNPIYWEIYEQNLLIGLFDVLVKIDFKNNPELYRSKFKL